MSLKATVLAGLMTFQPVEAEIGAGYLAEQREVVAALARPDTATPEHPKPTVLPRPKPAVQKTRTCEDGETPINVVGELFKRSKKPSENSKEQLDAHKARENIRALMQKDCIPKKPTDTP